MSVTKYLKALLKRKIETVHIGEDDIVFKARIILKPHHKSTFGIETIMWTAQIVDSDGDVLEEWDTVIGKNDTLSIDNILYKISID